MMIEFPRKLITVTTLTLAITLSACSTSGQKAGDNTPDIIDPLAEIKIMIQRARDMPSPQSENALIEASNQLVAQGKRKQARRILEGIDITNLPPAVTADRALALTRIAIEQQHLDTAVELLTTDTAGLLTASSGLDSERLNQISMLRAQLWEAQGNFLAAARERIFVAPMLDNTDLQQDNHQRIWLDLTQLPIETLDQLTHNIAIPELQGWLELAWIYKGNQDDIDQQIKAIQNWQRRYADHPAARQLPEAVRLLAEISKNKPQKIALLLPLQGKYRQSALAVQHGFMTAHYAASGTPDENGEAPEIRVYDTTDVGRFADTYREAVRDGADIIVGPLQKENVQQLAASTQTLPVTTIALNMDENTTETPSNLFQFALSPEDDAREVSHQAQRDNFSQVAIFYQQSPWGERTVNAFSEAWNHEGATINTKASFDSAQGLAANVKQMLLVDQSEARAQQLRRIIGRSFEFQPRRRQDIDFIYLIATPEQGRLIKPLFNFYFAENLPVYSGSQIFSGEDGNDKDRDLDGIRFCDLPWMLNNSDPMKSRLLDAWPKANPRFFRLNALGVDAYRLQTRVTLLQQVPGASLYGATGALSIGEDNHIHRELAWATIKDSHIKATPSVIDNSTTEQHGSKTTYNEETGGQPGRSAGPALPAATGI